LWSSLQRKPRTLKIALTAVLTALGVVLSPYLWFPAGGSKAYPGQHLINVIAGVLLGPIYTAIVATMIGIVRNALGIGTIFAFPGGLPGGIVVGIAYILAKKKIRNPMAMIVAASTEPIGTVLIGGTASWYLVDPFIGGVLHLKLGVLTYLYWLWLISSLSGVILSLPILLALYKMMPSLAGQ